MTTEQFNAMTRGISSQVTDAVAALAGIDETLGDLQDAFREASLGNLNPTKVTREVLLARDLDLRTREAKIVEREQDAITREAAVLNLESEWKHRHEILKGQEQSAVERDVDLQRRVKLVEDRERAVHTREVEVAHREEICTRLEGSQKKQAQYLDGIRDGLEQQNHDQTSREATLVSISRELGAVALALAKLASPKP